MSRNSISKLEAEWFKKLNNPNSGTYRLAHATPHDSRDLSRPFHPAKVAEGIKASAEHHLADHIAATSK